MDLAKDTYVLGIWFVGWKEGDWSATVIKRKNEPFRLEYRFRYYNPKSRTPWDGQDEKNFYSAVATIQDEERIISYMDAIAKLIHDTNEDSDILDSAIVRGDSDKLMEALKSKEWAHVKVVRDNRSVGPKGIVNEQT